MNCMPCSLQAEEQILKDHQPSQVQPGRSFLALGIPANPPYSSKQTQEQLHALPCTQSWWMLEGARGTSRGMSGRTEAMPGRCWQHTQGSAHLKFSFGAHSLSVPGHHPSRATCHPHFGWLVAPSGTRSGGSGRRQQQAAGRSEHAWALPPCAGTHTLSSSAGAWQLHGYV